MSTDQTIEQQIGDYVAWLDREFGPVDVSIPVPSRRRRGVVALVAASALLVTAGVVAIGAFRRDDSPIGTEVPPASGWTSFPAPPLEPRWDPVSIGTGDGWFVWGGVAPDTVAPTEVENMYDGAYYDVASAGWRVLPDAPIARASGQLWSAAWTGDEVVLVQAFEQPQAVAFDPATTTWRAIDVPDDVSSAWGGTGLLQTSWAGGRVVVVASGDPDVGRPVTAVTLDPATGSWSAPVPGPASLGPLADQVAAAPTEVLAVSRSGVMECTADAALIRFDVVTLRWSEVALPDPSTNPGFVAWSGGRVLVGGGTACDAELTPRFDAFALSPDTGVWERLPDLPIAIRYTQGDVLPVDGGVAIVGTAGALATYWDREATWTVTPSALGGPAQVAVASVDGRLAVWGAGLSRPGPQDGTATCCRPVAEAFIHALARPIDGAAPQTPVPTIPDTYDIRIGDDAATIAARLCVSTDELEAVNDGNTFYDGFVLGGALGVPVPSVEGCTPDLDPPRLAAYEVREGDTPTIVAARLCVTLDELIAVNAGLTATTRLMETEGIAVPPDSTGACNPGTRPPVEVPPPTVASPTSEYVVVEGDNPSRVAARLCVTVEELTAANEENEAYRRFLIGDELVAPAPSIDGCQVRPLALPMGFLDDLGPLAAFERTTADDALLGDGVPVLPDLTTFGTAIAATEGFVSVPPSGNSAVVWFAGVRADTGRPWSVTLNMDRRSPLMEPVDPAFLGTPVQLGAIAAYLGSDAGPQCPAAPEDGYNEVVLTWFDDDWTFSISATPLPGCEADSPFTVEGISRVVDSLLACSGFDTDAGGIPACRPMFP